MTEEKHILITREIPEPALSMLKEKGYSVTVGTRDRPLTKKELIKELRRRPYVAVITLLTDPVDSAVFDAAPQAKIFANYAVGYDNIDIEEAYKRNIFVTNVPGSELSGGAVGEHAVALTLALTSNVVAGDRYVRGGKYRGWSPTNFLGTDLPGKTFGIVGAGNIGTFAASTMHKGFGMNIVYTDIVANEYLESECGAKKIENIDELLKIADVVSLHVPLIPETHHLIDERRLRSMKKTAYLINTSRGPVIDEKALVAALKEEIIAGAALDVFEYEPKLTRGLTRLKNVIMTPHIASATMEVRTKMSKTAAENVIAVLETGKPVNPVPNKDHVS